MSKYKYDTPYNAMDHWHNVQSTAAGTCKTGERLSAERMAAQRAKAAQIGPVGPPLGPPLPDAIVAERKAESDRIYNEAIAKAIENIKAQFGEAAVLVKRSE